MSGVKSLLLGISLIILISIAGLIYRNAVEHPSETISCPVKEKMCPDGTAVQAIGTTCEFPACPPPNVSFGNPANISYAVPANLTAVTPANKNALAAYQLPAPPPQPVASTTASTTEPAPALEPSSIVIIRYPIQASSTATATIQATAISGTSGAPVPSGSFTAVQIGEHRFTVVAIERFEGVVDTAYYLPRAGDVIRFDAIDRNVPNWTDPSLDPSTLPAASALKTLLATLQGQ